MSTDNKNTILDGIKIPSFAIEGKDESFKIDTAMKYSNCSVTKGVYTPIRLPNVTNETTATAMVTFKEYMAPWL